ncbi:MAG: ribosome biogenesis GTPase Der [Faecalibacterium sp.]|jgi:GTP-binding protein|nr:ribosome biogenesis GTPase Der [Faecalibacterium sp.]
MAKPIVAVVGRPNVGKSTLFNKLCGQRIAIVEDTPGVTRDRIFGECEWCGKEFLLVDTGGIEPSASEGLLAHMRQQAEIAIDTANCIVMVVDVQTGMTAADQDVAQLLRRSRKPVILAVNKCDAIGEAPAEMYEFYNLGFDEVMPVSSVHGHGTGDLLDAICAHLDFTQDETDEERIPVAIIGRPNVGKSSLTNYILGENRMIVADEAGTTRDAIDTPVDNAYGKFVFTDTAGLRKKSNVDEGLERFMVLRSLAAVERSRVALILVDATQGFTEQDSKVAGYAHEQGKGCIIVVNKWDAVEGKDTYTMDEQRKGYEADFSFMAYAPVIFISAKSGYNVNKLMQMICDVDAQNGARVPTGVLNEMLARATARMQPPSDKGKRLKIFYLTQASTRPPTFVAFVNQKSLFHFSYQRYIINQIRESFGLNHTPIRLVVRERGGEARVKDV